MQDQHTKITGYRDLTQAEIDLMNEIKAEGERLRELINKVSRHLASTDPLDHETDQNRAFEHNPGRWLSIARTDFQTGLMALTRAVARPSSF